MAEFSSWPYPRPEISSINRRGYSISALLLCPNEPRKHFDAVLKLINQAGSEACRERGIPIFECERATDLNVPGIVTAQIWERISTYDMLFFDTSGWNPNVMIELGVAAAWHPPLEIVPIFNETIHQSLKMCDHDSRFPFNISQLRHFPYDLSSGKSIDHFLHVIKEIVFNALISIPREPLQKYIPVRMFDWQTGKGAPLSTYVSVPPRCHFTLDNEGLVFGAPHYFPASYMWLANGRFHNCVVETKFKFKPVLPFNQYWIGIKVRGSNVYANHGTLVYVNDGGDVHRVRVPAAPPPGHRGWEDGKPIAKLGEIDVKKDWITLMVESTDSGFKIAAGKNEDMQPIVTEIPSDDELIEFEGYPLIQTWQTRAIVSRIHFESKDQPPIE
jgi:hypothetical protein